MAWSPKTSRGGASPSSKVRPPSVKSAVYTVSTSSLTMEREAVTRALRWIASRGGSQITQAIILTDSMGLLQKEQKEKRKRKKRRKKKKKRTNKQTNKKTKKKEEKKKKKKKRKKEEVKSGRWNGRVQTGMCQCSTSTFRNSCECPALDMPEWRAMTD